MTDMITEIEAIELDDVAPYEDDGDKDRLTHIINPAMNGHIQNGIWMEAKDIVSLARLGRLEIVALCGHRFIPNHNPEKYDACSACMDIAGIIMSEDG